MPEQQKVGSLLIAVAAFADAILYQLADIDAAVGQLPLYWGLLPFAEHIAVDVADLGQASQHAGAVAVAQAALDTVFFI